MPDGPTIAWCIAIGVATGVISALCGVGGGIIMVPAFVFILKMQPRGAVATSLFIIILTAAAASAKNLGNRFVDFQVAIPTALASAVVAWFAADWLKHLSNTTITRLFAVLVIAMGIRMLWAGK